MSDLGQGRRPPVNIPFIVITLALVGAAATFVTASLRRPELDMFPPTSAAPSEVGSAMVGPRVFTADATGGGWSYFDFSRSSGVDVPMGANWDLAFRRNSIIVNGGPGFNGHAGVLTSTIPFDSMTMAPTEGYVANRVRGDTTNSATKDWYDYSWMSHVLRPKAATFVVRTADGKYAKLEILSYYCPGAIAGCITFRYVYQGAGTRQLSSVARVEAHSLLGEPLFPPTLSPEVATDRLAKFEVVLADLDSSPAAADAMIWAGRRHGYIAHYLNGEFALARAALRECITTTRNDDTRVATAYWSYLTLRRLGREEDVSAADLLGPGGDATLAAETKSSRLGISGPRSATSAAEAEVASMRGL